MIETYNLHHGSREYAKRHSRRQHPDESSDARAATPIASRSRSSWPEALHLHPTIRCTARRASLPLTAPSLQPPSCLYRSVRYLGCAVVDRLTCSRSFTRRHLAGGSVKCRRDRRRTKQTRASARIRLPPFPRPPPSLVWDASREARTPCRGSEAEEVGSSPPFIHEGRRRSSCTREEDSAGQNLLHRKIRRPYSQSARHSYPRATRPLIRFEITGW